MAFLRLEICPGYPSLSLTVSVLIFWSNFELITAFLVSLATHQLEMEIYLVITKPSKPFPFLHQYDKSQEGFVICG